MTDARITCPKCGHVQDIKVPENVCLQFYVCESCGETIQKTADSCCVICDYSDTKCEVSIIR